MRSLTIEGGDIFFKGVPKVPFANNETVIQTFRRAEPRTRSQNELALGARNCVFRILMPEPSATRANWSLNLLSLSRIR